MSVPGDRIGGLDSCERRSEPGNEHGCAAPRGIDVQPCIRLASDLSELAERIDDAAACRSGSANDQKWASPCTEVETDSLLQRQGVHREPCRRRNLAQRIR